MPRYDVELHVEVEAADSNQAFAAIRHHFSMANEATGELIDFVIADNGISLLEEGEAVIP